MTEEKKTTDKKQLDQEELDQVSGGVMSPILMNRS